MAKQTKGLAQDLATNHMWLFYCKTLKQIQETVKTIRERVLWTATNFSGQQIVDFRLRATRLPVRSHVMSINKIMTEWLNFWQVCELLDGFWPHSDLLIHNKVRWLPKDMSWNFPRLVWRMWKRRPCLCRTQWPPCDWKSFTSWLLWLRTKLQSKESTTSGRALFVMDMDCGPQSLRLPKAVVQNHSKPLEADMTVHNFQACSGVGRAAAEVEVGDL